jgi:diguanylate cyclase (GGDEF)-like protein
MHSNIHISKKNYKNLISSFFIVFFVLTFLFSCFYYFWNKTQFDLDRTLIKEDEIINIEKGEDTIYSDLAQTFTDLEYIKYNYINYLTINSNYESISKNFSSFAYAKKIYDQIRFIDSSGKETLRINNSQGNIAVVEKELLQNKSDRYYFIETMKLKDGEIFISQFDLNKENGVIETPLKPTLRMSTPIYIDGQIKGIIIINYLAQNLIDNFTASTTGSAGEIHLLNKDSYWLINEDASKQWGFMYESKLDNNFTNYYREEWDLMQNKSQSQFITSKGLFTYSSINSLLNQSILLSTYENKTKFYDDKWIILSHIDAENEQYGWIILSDFKLVFNKLLEQYYFLLALLLASLITAILYSSNKQYSEEIEYFAKYDALTNVLNRRAGYEILNKEVTKSKSTLKSLCICFIDINGLKIINDSLGHDSGDLLIKTVASNISETIRSTDYLIRLGGDEFIIILPDTSFNKAEESWLRINEKFNLINNTENLNFNISLSHGISEYNPTIRNSVDIIISTADEKMYEEKKSLKANIEEFNKFILKKNF